MPVGMGRGDDLLQRAVFALNNHRPDEAERIARDVLKAVPQQPQALQILGRALLVQGRAQDAITLLEPVARSRHDPEIDTQLAMALHKVGRDEDALARLKRATKRPPPYVPALRELGSLLYAMERYPEAAEALRLAVQAAPMMPDLAIQLGYAYLQCRNCADAKAAFGRALDIAPAPDALFGMARAHQGAGENAPAVEFFRRHLVGQARQLGGLAQPRPLSARTRRARCRLRMLSHGGARRRQTLRQRARLVGEIGPRPVLAETERGSALPAGAKKLALRRLT